MKTDEAKTNKITPSQSAPQIRKPYSSPVLSQYGSIKVLTLGMDGGSGDGVSGMQA
jgi:hypothetical protein